MNEERRNLSCSHIPTTFFAIDDKLQRSKIKIFHRIYILGGFVVFRGASHVQEVGSQKI